MSSLQRQHKNAPLAPSLKCSKPDDLGDLVNSTLFRQMNLEQMQNRGRSKALTRMCLFCRVTEPKENPRGATPHLPKGDATSLTDKKDKSYGCYPTGSPHYQSRKPEYKYASYQSLELFLAH